MKRLAAIALLLPIVWLFALPVPPIQHSPWTTTTNDPSVTLQAQQPVSITTTNAIAFIANGLMATTNAVNGMLNVHAYGATGNGTTVDTVALQAAIDSAAAQNTGIFLPPGNYKTGRLIWTAGFRGITGVPTYSATKNSLQFVAYLTLANGANTNLLYIPPGSYGSVRDVCFVGNRTNQTAGAALVYVDIANYTGFIRNETKFSGCAFIWGKSHGIEIHREEVILDNCMVIENDGDGGHYVDAVDCVIGNDTGFGRNGGWGLALLGNSSAMRLVHSDTFSNHKGGVLLDGLSPVTAIDGQEQNSFIRLESNNNLGPNLMVTNVVGKMVFVDAFFAGANFDGDGNGYTNPWPTGTWPDILFSSGSAYMPAFTFLGCRIGLVSGPTSTKLPSYHILDARDGPIYTNGIGMTFQGGYIWSGAGTATSGLAIYPSTFTENAMCLCENGTGQFYSTRLSHGDILIGGSIISDDAGWIKIYKQTNLLFGLEMAEGPATNRYNTNYFTISTNRAASFPGGLTTLGALTNGGNIEMSGYLDFALPGAPLSERLYQILGGGIGLVSGLGTGTTNYWAFNTNSVTQTAGAIRMPWSTNVLNGALIGGHNWFLYPSNTVFYVCYSDDGTNVVTMAGFDKSTGEAVFSFVQPTNMSPSTLAQTDGNGVLVSLANQAGSVLGNAGSNPFWSTNLSIIGNADLVGTLGVGTTTPQTKLAVKTVGDALGFSIGDVSGATGKRLQMGYFQNLDYGFIDAENVGSGLKPIAINQYGGAVGIGQVPGTEQLEVTGNIKATGHFLIGTNILSVSGTNLMFNGGTVNVTY